MIMFHAIFIFILINTNVCCYEFWKKVCVCVCVCVCNKAATSHSKINIVKRIAIRKYVLEIQIVQEWKEQSQPMGG